MYKPLFRDFKDREDQQVLLADEASLVALVHLARQEKKAKTVKSESQVKSA
jgi:hypothetical protein